jgi:hypothetical protein
MPRLKLRNRSWAYRLHHEGGFFYRCCNCKAYYRLRNQCDNALSDYYVPASDISNASTTFIYYNGRCYRIANLVAQVPEPDGIVLKTTDYTKTLAGNTLGRCCSMTGHLGLAGPITIALNGVQQIAACQRQELPPFLPPENEPFWDLIHIRPDGMPSLNTTITLPTACEISNLTTSEPWALYNHGLDSACAITWDPADDQWYRYRVTHRTLKLRRETRDNVLGWRLELFWLNDTTGASGNDGVPRGFQGFDGWTAATCTSNTITIPNELNAFWGDIGLMAQVVGKNGSATVTFTQGVPLP